MKNIVTVLLILCVSSAVRAEIATHAYNFDWAHPTTLNPQFSVPTGSDDGEYISNEEFTSGPVTFTVNDDAVYDSSQKARFFYAYMYSTVEIRAFPHSVIVIQVPDGKTIDRVEFIGNKVSDKQLVYTGEMGSLKGQIWKAAEGCENVPSVEFYVQATINCTYTAVRIGDAAGVSDVCTDAPREDAVWYTTHGVRLEDTPRAAGLYLRRQGRKCEKVIIR